jgi:DNA topoisomerase VI subunit A
MRKVMKKEKMMRKVMMMKKEMIRRRVVLVLLAVINQLNANKIKSPRPIFPNENSFAFFYYEKNKISSRLNYYNVSLKGNVLCFK